VITLLKPEAWKEYRLIDSGNFEKLEQFGAYILRRPEPQAVWSPSLGEREWRKMPHAVFSQTGSHTGRWEKLQSMPDRWVLNYAMKEYSLKMRLALTGFKHVGVFPEQAANWDFIYKHASGIPQARVLNLFAYTGGASLAARRGGAIVSHVDSIKQVVNWANENTLLNGLDGIRWVVEDAVKFVQREVRRGNTYHGIILDPPSFGHGAKGEKWKIEDHINELIQDLSKLLDPTHNFFVFNCYSIGFSSLVLETLIHSHFKASVRPQLEIGELFLEEQSRRKLPAGVFARFGKL